MKKLLLLPSTRKFYQEARRTPGYSFFDWLHGYIYGRWTHLYIAIGVGEHPLARLFGRLSGWLGRRPSPEEDERSKTALADSYHGKVVPLAAARQLVMVREPIARPLPETVIPYAKARDLVLQDPQAVAVLDCPCRSARQHPCLPLDVCLVVGEPFVSFLVEHQPGRARRISQEQAVAILKAEDERGHVHHAFFKDAMLNRFYAICSCCACCCGAIHAQRSGIPMLASSGYLCQVDIERCMACGECMDYCQFGALRYTTPAEMAARLYGMVVEPDLCMGCGVCTGQCANGALNLQLAPQKGLPLSCN